MVLVTGAGPVGLTLAGALARRGIAVRIVDSNAQRTDKSKALVIWSRTLELLDIEDDGCAQSFIDAGLRGLGTHLFAQTRELVHVQFADAPTRYNFALLIPQSETERVLEARLAALGVHVERETTLSAFTARDDGVTATLRLADGSSQVVDCAYLCGCDGAHSTVRHGLGMEFAGTAMEGSWLLADVHLTGNVATQELTMGFTRDGVFALFPIVGNRFRVLADIAGDSGDDPPTLAEVQAVIDARAPVPLVASKPLWLSRFRINERKVADFRRGRVYLAGDAAHIHSPAGGQGMNTGMQDAFNLAWKLALVSQGRAGARLLDSYTPERGPVAESVLRNAGRMTEVALLHNPLMQALRNVLAATLSELPAVRRRFVDQLTELDIAYPHSPLTRNATQLVSHAPGPGARAEDVPVRDAAGRDTRLHALLRDGRFVLLSAGASLPAIAPAMQPLVQAATTASDRYARGHVFLVRPDAYVSTTAPAGSADDALTWLAAIAA